MTYTHVQLTTSDNRRHTFTDTEWAEFVDLAGDGGVDVHTLAVENVLSAEDAARCQQYLATAEFEVVETHDARRIRSVGGSDTDPVLATAARVGAVLGLDVSDARIALLDQAAHARVVGLSTFESARIAAWVAILDQAGPCNVEWV